MARAAANLARRYSTEHQAAASRAAWWRETICEVHFGVDFESRSDRPYRASLSTVRSGAYQLTDIRAANAVVSRTPQNIRQDPSADYAFLVPFHGGFSATQFRNRGECLSQAFTLVDAGEPFSLRQNGDARIGVFKVPRAKLEERLPDPQALCGTAVGAVGGMPKLAYGFLRSLLEEADEISPEALYSACQQLLDLLALALQTQDGRLSAETSVRISNLRRLKRYIGRHLTAPELAPRQAAMQCGISVRYLHDLFADTDMTFGAYLRGERLKRGRRLLEDPLHRHRSITKIAFDCGFSSSGHFSSAFKAAFGLSPSDVRASHPPAD